MSSLDPTNNPSQDLSVTRRNINVHSYGVIKIIMGNRIVDSLPLRLRCECSIPICEEIIEITLAERRDLRRKYASAFIVVIAHAPTVDSILSFQTTTYGVIEKAGYEEPVIDL
jgi:hypothetical protein